MSKNYQIKYSVKADDLTTAGVNKAIANLKRLADAQKKLDEDRIKNRHKVLAKIYAEKQSKQNEQFAKKEGVADLARYRQLLGRKALMEKVHSLRKLKGDEEGLRKYRRTQQGILTALQNKYFDKGDYKGKAANLAEQLTAQGRLNRSEFMLGSAIDANNRKREQSLRLQERQVKQAARLQERLNDRRQQGQVAIGAASGAALYGGGKASGYAIREAMTMEQLSIAMRAQFGVEEGNKVMKEMKDYSLQTMFKLEDAIQMLLDVKKGGANIGLDTTAKQLTFTKQLGRPLLAYATNQERRSEAGYQLGQIWQAKTADERQDIKVIARSGIPIYSALQSMTGKSYDQLQEIYGAQLPADLIAKAMIYLASSEQTMRAMLEYEKSLTMSVQAASEQLGFTSAAFGDTIAKALKIPSLLRAVTTSMGSVEDKLKTGKISDMFSFGYVAGGVALGILSLRGALIAAGMAFKYFTGSALTSQLAIGAILGYIPTLVSSFAAGGLVYMAFADWKSVLDDINKAGFKGLLNHMGILLAGVATIAGIIAMLATGNIVGAGALAVGALGVVAYKTAKWNDDKKWSELRDQSNTTNTPNMAPILDKSYKQPSIEESLKSLGLTIVNNVNTSTGEVKNKVFMNNNPVYAGFGQQSNK